MDPQRGGDILQSGSAAVNEMTALIAALEKKVSVFAHLAFSDMSVEMGPPLHVDGALSRITQELSVLRKKAESVIQRWRQGEEELHSLTEYNEFWSSHKEVRMYIRKYILYVRMYAYTQSVASSTLCVVLVDALDDE